MDEEQAELVAISALQFLASDDQQMSRFVALCGVDIADMRKEASNPVFLAGILDFFLAHEPTLLSFASGHGIEPEQILIARNVLDPHSGREY